MFLAPVACFESEQTEASRLLDSTGAMFRLGLVVGLALFELSLCIDDVKMCAGVDDLLCLGGRGSTEHRNVSQIDWNGVIICSKCHIKWSLVCTGAQLALGRVECARQVAR